MSKSLHIGIEAPVFELEDFKAPEPSPGDEGRSAMVPKGKASRPGYSFEPMAAADLSGDPLTQAYRSIEAAETQAKAISEKSAQEVQAAQDQAAGIRQAAYDEGFEQGRQDGIAAEKARVAAALDNLERTINALADARALVLENMESEIIALVQACLEKLCQGEAAQGPEVLKNVLRQAVAQAADEQYLSVRLSQADLGLAKEFKPELLGSFESLKRLDLILDADMHPGSCVVNGPTIQIDATLNTRRQRVLDMLEEALHQTPALEIGDPTEGPALETSPEAESQGPAGEPDAEPSDGDAEGW